MRVSVGLDCLDPDSLVTFWEAALGYRLVDRADGYRILAPAAGGPGSPVAAYGVERPTMADPEGHEFCVVAHGRLDLYAPEGDA